MKVVGTDNFARENVADILIAENVTQEEGARIVAEHNSPSENFDGRWYILVDDDYRLWRGMADLV